LKKFYKKDENIDDYYFEDSKIPKEMITNVKKESNCELEIDINSNDIQNIQFIIKTEIKHDNHEYKLVHSLSKIWEDERKRRNLLDLKTQPTQILESQKRYSQEMSEIEKLFHRKLEELVLEQDITFTYDPNKTNEIDVKKTEIELNWMKNDQNDISDNSDDEEFLSQKEVEEIL
jgi:hypothetical protein